jgi:methylmalonyl-CoA mutase
VSSLKDNANKFDAFKSAGLKEWEAAAREELNGANPWEKLTHKGEGWSSRPYYEQQAPPITSPLLSNSGNEFLGARAWFNCPRIIVQDVEKSNQMALNFLQQGADGIFFELNENVNFNNLLEGIQLQYCSLSFLAKQDPIPTASALQAFFRKKNSDGTGLQGAFFGNTVIESDQARIFKFSGFQIPDSGNPAADIAMGFNTMITVTGQQIGAQINSIAFSVSMATDFFVELAKVRAIRIVWKKLLYERGLTDEAKLFVHAVSLPWKTNDFEPHGNMLKSTTAAMASILGGCDALTIDAEDRAQAMQQRVARNVSNILREESFFSKVADPVAGSYFVEDLTNQIAEGAWKSIQQQ